MMSSRQLRINKAIDSLVRQLLPDIPDEDPSSAEEREENAIAFVKEVLESASKNPVVGADINQASDLIKKRLIQTNPTPEKALRFSNLYSRLLSIPVISQKWAILYFLYQLGDQQSSHPTLTSPFKTPTKDDQQDRKNLEEERLSQSQFPVPKRDEASDIKYTARRRTIEEVSPRDRGEPVDDIEPSRTQTSGRRNTMTDRKENVGLKMSDMIPSETVLLRELPFTLQGVSSKNLVFSTETSLEIPPTLPVPIVSLLNTLAEPALLYRQLNNFTQTSEGGLLGQSLRAAIARELRSYLALTAALESQIRAAVAKLDGTTDRISIGKAGVTLKRCVVSTREATTGLRLMNWICEESKSKRGGVLISLIHSLSSHGDPMVESFAEGLLLHVTRPFYSMLRQWIYDGELSDPYHEFFVSEHEPSAVTTDQDGRTRGGASSVWQDKYKLDQDMIPSIITQDFAQKVFLIGKSLNFIRYSCGDSEWVTEYSRAASKELQYGDTATLETWIDEAYKTTMTRLIHLMSEKFHLFEHLKALKNYILLGQGDFIALLMESLASNLDRPAGAQYRHTLTAQLEHAIRGSNAQYDSAEVLRRLDARMLQLSHGDIGWDCFTLEYKIDAPVDVVVTDWGNRQYLKMFNFLWRIKRVEFALATTWRKCMTGARGVLQSQDPSIVHTWKLTRGVLAEMNHFIGQLQYYILFEVIESSWDELQAAIHKEGCTLDDLIKAHTKYLEAITHKGLLGAKKKHGGEENTFMMQLSEILRIMLNYRDAVDGLYSWAVSEFTRRQGADVRTDAHKRDNGEDLLYGATPATSRRGPRQLLDSTPLGMGDDSIPDELPVLKERLQSLGSQFRTRLCLLLGDLAYQPDQDMRFLGVVMNFNDWYQKKLSKSSLKESVMKKTAGR
ncbi:Spc98 family-domain-containing protein [Xylogone sp. PMI_703]|nr:Spc98 family-domain-containing protein [Xylogone sp. PMI_703]